MSDLGTTKLKLNEDRQSGLLCIAQDENLKVESYQELKSRNEINDILKTILGNKQHSGEMFFKAFQCSPEPISITTLEDGLFIEANEAFCRITGYKSEELINHTCHELGIWVYAQDCARIRKLMEDGRIYGLEISFRKKTGETRLGLLSAEKIEVGNTQCAIFVISDITEHRLVEQRLRQSEERYRLLTENTADVMWTVNLDSPRKLTYISPSVTRVLGFSVEEAMNLNMEEAMTSSSFKTAMNTLAKEMSVEAGEQKKQLRSKTLELELNHNDGSTVPVEVKFSFLYGPDGQPREILAVARDITEHKQAEETHQKLQRELSVSSRLASVGELASGVAHEINNPLTAVIGFSQMLMTKDMPEDAKEYLQIIDQNAQRVAKIVKNLLTFARQRKPTRETVDVNDLISKVVELRAYEMRTRNIVITTGFATGKLLTLADGGQLQQVFLNIILNAEQAMVSAHNKGNLKIKTERSDNIIRISFSDDGPGIDNENLDKIFDPFFTTKPVGEGTGLGLSLSYGIIKEHKGKIYAESVLGQGATFIIELPIVTELERIDLPELSVDENKKGSGARVMVVDDELSIRQLLSCALAKDGHNVEAVDNASVALERLERQRYALVLLDVQMAGMDGIELYKRMGQIARSLQQRVVFISGDTMSPATHNYLKSVKARCISKPFDIEQLKKEINQILLEQNVKPVS